MRFIPQFSLSSFTDFVSFGRSPKRCRAIRFALGIRKFVAILALTLLNGLRHGEPLHHVFIHIYRWRSRTKFRKWKIASVNAFQETKSSRKCLKFLVAPVAKLVCKRYSKSAVRPNHALVMSLSFTWNDTLLALNVDE